jgi:hypothetical protein
MHWDWATFGIGVVVGGIVGVAVAVAALFIFARGMSDAE